MRFWDTSALVPLLIEQDASRVVRKLMDSDAGIVAWWGTSIECASAAARLRREGVLTMDDEERVLSLLDMLRDAWTEILPGEVVLREGRRLLRVHALRAADALQLAAALQWSGSPGGEELVTFYERLRLAARLEGFRVLPG